MQIGGPTGAFVVVVASIATRYGLDGLILCTLMAGVILIVLGLTGMGSAIKFIPRPIIIGFTNGIALLIASTQLRDFFGFRVASVPSDFLPRMQLLISRVDSITGASVALGCVCLVVLLLIRWRAPLSPAYPGPVRRNHRVGHFPFPGRNHRDPLR